ncbi:E3 ubiquitin/ISG15 ligase TRIM25-like isoform X2 [Sardina pilchardus]|uniref:E3 ubiquitin/ISG15 ligase TRIM25-like isoform X2 n=1 Tax=Sardina pilchardus TaxID=27697 RepID=UPI002E1550AE
MATDTSLPSLEDELTCSICMCIFESPVTLPCGHNFCQGCLDVAWKENVPLACPHCRHTYSSKPELKKNTVLSAIVETIKTSSSESDYSKDVPVKQETDVVKCDTCIEVKAFKTCLTCMASFCEEHLKPHEENPVFRAHQLTDPLGDLQERICQDHCKIKEFFCNQHECSICSTCLQAHRDCDYTTPQERREQKESEISGMLTLLERKIDKNNIVIAQMRQQELELQDDAVARKKMVNTKYQLMRDLIDRDEQDALRAVDKELESGQTKLQSLTKMFGQNVEKMSHAKVELSDLLSRVDSMSFLQASVQLPFNAKFDPYCPRMNTDSEAVTAYQSSAVAVKQLLDKILSVPAENRISLLAAFEKVPDKGDILEVSSPAPEVACQKLISDARQVREMATPTMPELPQERNYSPGYNRTPGPVYYHPPPPQVVHVVHFQPAQNPDKKPDTSKGQKKAEKSEHHHRDKDKKPDASKGQKKAEKSEHHHHDKDHGKKTPKPTPSGKPPTQSSGSSGKPPTKSSGSSRPASAPTKSSGSSRPASAPSRRGK